MIEIFSKYTLILLGLFFIMVGLLMFFQPEIIRKTIRKAGSTKFINYVELLTRMLPGIAFILYSKYSNYMIIFNVIGYFIILSSIILLLIPRKIHNRFSVQCAEILKPNYFKIISPFSIIIGIILIVSII